MVDSGSSRTELFAELERVSARDVVVNEIPQVLELRVEGTGDEAVVVNTGNVTMSKIDVRNGDDRVWAVDQKDPGESHACPVLRA